MSVRVPYGLREGELFSPEEVPSGLDCQCVCPNCGARLQAKKGEKNVWHFAHDGTEGTAACVEASIRLWNTQADRKHGAGRRRSSHVSIIVGQEPITELWSQAVAIAHAKHPHIKLAQLEQPGWRGLALAEYYPLLRSRLGLPHPGHDVTQGTQHS